MQKKLTTFTTMTTILIFNELKCSIVLSFVVICSEGCQGAVVGFDYTDYNCSVYKYLILCFVVVVVIVVGFLRVQNRKFFSRT